MLKLKPFIVASMLLTSQLSFATGDVSFTTDQAYPEGSAWSAKENVFFVSSVHRGVIGKVSMQGKYTPFITDEKLVGTVGLKLDTKHNILWVANSDSGASVRSSVATSGKLAALVGYNASTGEQVSYHDLASLIPGGHFANDLTFDGEGNIYVTDSFSPVIYRINAKGEASIFVKNDLFIGEGFNLNGIVYHPDGFLLVSKYNSGELFKIDVNNPSQIEKVALPETLKGMDGLLLQSPSRLIAVQNMGIDRTVTLVSKDGWKSATIQQVKKSKLSFPTTATMVGKNVYVLNAQLGTLFNPNAAPASDYILQKQ
jgi:sugar lactone lactonase YvrE